MPIFPDNLKRARLKQKLTPDEAAELCGVARSSWYAYEAGAKKPPLDSLLRIAAKLDTTGERLLKGVR